MAGCELGWMGGLPETINSSMRKLLVLVKYFYFVVLGGLSETINTSAGKFLKLVTFSTWKCYF